MPVLAGFFITRLVGSTLKMVSAPVHELVGCQTMMYPLWATRGVIALMKGVVWREDDERHWQHLLTLQARVRDHLAVINRPVIDWAARRGIRLASPVGANGSGMVSVAPPDPAAVFASQCNHSAASFGWCVCFDSSLRFQPS